MIGSSIEKWAGGATAHGATILGELGPAAKAQRQEFKKAKGRMRTDNYGFSEAQTQQAQAQGNQALAGQQQQQQADIARAQAAGQLAGGAATEAQRMVANQAQAGAAQVAGQVQQASNAYAQGQYDRDQARIDAQAQRWRDVNAKQADISMQTTGAGSGGGSEVDYSKTRKVAPEEEEVFGARSVASAQPATAGR